MALVFLKEPHINTSVFQEAAQRRINTVINTGSMATNNFTAAIIEAVNQLLKMCIRDRVCKYSYSF